jgi:protein tyrosine/serine phosphatase
MKKELKASLAGLMLLAVCAATLPETAAASLDSAAVAGKVSAILGEFAPGTVPPEVAAAPVVLSAAAKPSAGQALSDFAQVTPNLYRSGQPTQAGVAKIASLKIKTILKLNDDDPQEADWAASDGVTLDPMLMSNEGSPTYQQIDAALAVINDTSKQPVLVHCHLGHDRTGAVIGAYRVAVQGWSVAQAASEALSMGYSDPKFQNITTYLQGYLDYLQQK